MRNDQTGEGFVYAMRSTNPANSNEFKVGLTIDPELRRRKLSGTASAFPFAFERVWAVTNMALAEDVAHRMLRDHRINDDREHFYIIPMESREALFGTVWHDPTDDEVDVCLDVLLDRIESMFTFSESLGWYDVDPGKLHGYYRDRRALSRGKPGAAPLEPLF